MTIAVVILIILASIIVVMVIRRTRGMDSVTEKPTVVDASLTIDEARSLFVDGELTTRAGFLHYDLSEAFEVDDKELGVFTGYVKPDAQHDGELIVSDDKGMLRGTITGQMAFYASLLNRRRAVCYGFELKDDDGYRGEVCVQNIL